MKDDIFFEVKKTIRDGEVIIRKGTHVLIFPIDNKKETVGTQTSEIFHPRTEKEITLTCAFPEFEAYFKYLGTRAEINSYNNRNNQVKE